MEIYKTIRETRKIIEGIYNTQSHESTRKMIGVTSRLYNEIRYYNTVVVAEQITPEIYQRLRDFIAVHKLPDEDPPKNILDEEPIRPKPPIEVYVDNDVQNPKPVKLTGASMNLVNAMAKLREAMEPFYGMGYHIGVTLYRRPMPEELD